MISSLVDCSSDVPGLDLDKMENWISDFLVLFSVMQKKKKKDLGKDFTILRGNLNRKTNLFRFIYAVVFFSSWGMFMMSILYCNIVTRPLLQEETMG